MYIQNNVHGFLSLNYTFCVVIMDYCDHINSNNIVLINGNSNNDIHDDNINSDILWILIPSY